MVEGAPKLVDHVPQGDAPLKPQGWFCVVTPDDDAFPIWIVVGMDWLRWVCRVVSMTECRLEVFKMLVGSLEFQPNSVNLAHVGFPVANPMSDLFAGGEMLETQVCRSDHEIEAHEIEAFGRTWREALQQKGWTD